MSNKVKIGIALPVVLLLGFPLAYKQTQETADKSTRGRR